MIVNGRKYELGNKRSGGICVQREPLPQRPNVIAKDDTSGEWIEYEIVWYPHRDAASLIGDMPQRFDRAERGTVRIGSNDITAQRWSFQG